MKNLLIIMLLTLPLFSQGQVSMDFGGGAARMNQISEKEMTKIMVPVVKVGIGYQLSNIVAELMMQPTLTNLVNSPNYFGGKIGYDFHNIIASAGYFYNLCNSDLPENNGGAFGYSLKYRVPINENGGLYAEAIRINKVMEATVGFQIVF